MKKFLKIFAAVVVLLVGISFATGYGYVWGGMRETYLRGWKNANIDDLEFREVRTLTKAPVPQPWPEALLPESALPAEELAALDASGAASFLVIQADTLRYERYAQGHDRTTVTNSFSMAKTITALALGLAEDRGLVRTGDEVGKHLPRFSGEAGRGLTVEEVLQMRSHIPFGEDYKNPLGFMARAYYRGDIRGLIAPYRPASDPGTEWEYQGGNTMLLEEIVLEATDVPVGRWVETELWHRMGAESDAYWGLDAPEAEGGVERSFAQFYATSRDYARFGQLLLDTGRWRGVTLVGEDYAQRLLSPIAERTRESDVRHYGYQIWLGTDGAGDAFAVMQGHRGQYIIIVPARELVIVRTGYEVDPAKENHIPLEVNRCIDRAKAIVGGAGV